MGRVISSVAGTRIEPKDSYTFIRGTTATFKTIFTSNTVPTQVDTLTVPQAKIIQPNFLNQSGSPVPQVLATINGTLVPGQEFEYQFQWDIPSNLTPIDDYIISYNGVLGGNNYNFGDEYFTISSHAGMIGMRTQAYATVDDIRKHKMNIDTFMPEQFRKDLDTRNQVIQEHLEIASQRLIEELNLTKARGYSVNYKLFCIYYTIWSLLLSSRGEDGSSVSSENLNFWASEWQRILSQEKRKSVMQGIPVGRG